MNPMIGACPDDVDEKIEISELSRNGSLPLEIR